MSFKFKNPYNFKSKKDFLKYCEKLKNLPTDFKSGNFKYAWAETNCKDYMITVLKYEEKQVAFYFHSNNEKLVKELITFS